MAVQPLPPLQFLRECLNYDPLTGILLWAVRPEHHFATAYRAKGWNAQHAGTPAFATPDDEGYLRGEILYEGRRHRSRAHRVIFKLMTGRDPELVDHRQGTPGDNRWENLRDATRQQNGRNRGPNKGRDLPKCVYRENGRYTARVSIGPKKHYLGAYETPEEAHAAFCAFARPRHGEFFNAG